MELGVKYIFQRIGFYLVAAWVSVTLNFILPRLMPGDPASLLLSRISGRLRPEQIDALKKVYGLTNSPLPVQYIQYLKQVLHGNLGISIYNFPTPVSEVIATGLMWTLLLGLTAVVISFVLGNLIGVIAAWRRGGWVDSVMPPLMIFIGSFPYFWLAMLCLFVFGFELKLFPISHAFGMNVTVGFNLPFLIDVVRHTILPAITIVLVSTGGWALGMRNTMIGVLSEDYITMADAKGLSNRRIMFGYAARNALLPAVTGFGIALGYVVGGALLTEIVFSYPGLGFQLLTAVQNLDYPLMQGLLLVITLAVLIANFIVDLIYVRLDPRVRIQARE